MRTVFVLFISALFFYTALHSRLAAAYGYWWFSIFRPQDWVWNGIIPGLRLPLIAVVLLIIPSLLQKKYPKINHPISVLILIWLILVFIADLLNGCSDMLGVRTNTVLGLAVFFYAALLTGELLESKKDIFWLLLIMAVSIGYNSGKGGLHALISGADYYGLSQLTGLFTGSNGYALGSAILLFFMIFSFQQINSHLVYNSMNKWYNKPFLLKIYRYTLLIMVLGSIYNIVSLQSRGSFIAMIIGLIIWLMFQKNMARKVIVLGVIAIIASNFITLPAGYNDRIESAFVEEDELDKSAASRPHFWRVAMSIVKDHPLGVGPGCYPKFYNFYDTSNGYFGFSRSVHSSHFQILSDSGYLGAIVWILLFIVSYTKLWSMKRLVEKKISDPDENKFYRDLVIMLICSQTVFVLGGSFYEYAYNDLTWLIFALVISTEKIIKKEISKLKVK